MLCLRGVDIGASLHWMCRWMESEVSVSCSLACNNAVMPLHTNMSILLTWPLKASIYVEGLQLCFSSGVRDEHGTDETCMLWVRTQLVSMWCSINVEQHPRWIPDRALCCEILPSPVKTMACADIRGDGDGGLIYAPEFTSKPAGFIYTVQANYTLMF